MNQKLHMADGLHQQLAQAAEPPGPNEPEASWRAMDLIDGQSHLLPSGSDTTPATHADDRNLTAAYRGDCRARGSTPARQSRFALALGLAGRRYGIR